ncbi:hypothetical protein M2254_002609 [Chryseobacterium sp. BIGb0186]|uniref:hypothetical protein n=1 Tax=Chryseobacterium sp. BIGb0186 TaxID=2940558 RepID=UPI002473DA29|nr:hypothetical protein [Chryseobacterium sp. BIGb0186]MDH6211025.1 hypothetical protein [Chryseobacterium sp. BIGb0186]
MDSFEEQQYLESKLRFDIGAVWVQLVNSKPQTKDYIESIENKFCEIEDYGEKLLFWKDNNLSLFKLQYEFTIYNENNEEVNPVISITPKHNTEKLQYLNFIIEECYKEYYNNPKKYNFETVPFEQLTKRFFESNESRDKFIRFEENSTKNRIKETGVSTDVYNYIKFKQREPNVLSDLNFIDVVIPITLQYFAIELSYVYDYIKYLIFLKSQNKKEVTVNEVFSENKTFNSTYDIPKLKNIHSLLEEKKIIQKIDFEDFKLIFTEAPLKEIKNKIVWLPKKGKGVYWESLIFFIKEICGYPESYFNTYSNKQFIDRIGRCFKSETETGFNNYNNGIPRGITNLKANKFRNITNNKNYQKIKDIFS